MTSPTAAAPPLTYDAVIADKRAAGVPPLDLAGAAATASPSALSPALASRADADAALLATVGADLGAYVRDVAVQRDAPVSRHESPAALAAALAAEGAPLPLAPDDPPTPVRPLIAAVLAHSVRSGHPRFLSQLYGRADAAAIAADWTVAAAPAAVHTWEAAPVASAAEAAVVTRLAALAGGDYADGGAGGLCLPGGSAANAAAMVAARHVADPAAKTRGAAGGPKLVAFVSEGAHFSFDKAAATMGLGTANLIKVPTRPDTGAMDATALASALATAVAEGRTPFFVGATAGTTVFGAFDPIDAVAEIADAYGCWLHVDGAWGGAALLSPDHSYLLSGLARSDSFCLSPHKMLGVPLQCAVLVTRRGGILAAANAVSGDGNGDGGGGYLYQRDAPHADADRGDAYGGCGRRADGLKLWLAWKAAGEAGFGAKVDAAVGLAAYAAAAVGARGDGALALAAQPAYANVLFYYVPPAARPYDPAAPPDHPSHAALMGVTPAVRARVAAGGGPLVAYAPLPGRPHAAPAFRMVLANPASVVKTTDVDAVLEAIVRAGDAKYAA